MMKREYMILWLGGYDKTKKEFILTSAGREGWRVAHAREDIDKFLLERPTSRLRRLFR